MCLTATHPPSSFLFQDAHPRHVSPEIKVQAAFGLEHAHAPVRLPLCALRLSCMPGLQRHLSRSPAPPRAVASRLHSHTKAHGTTVASNSQSWRHGLVHALRCTCGARCVCVHLQPAQLQHAQPAEHEDSGFPITYPTIPSTPSIPLSLGQPISCPATHSCKRAAYCCPRSISCTRAWPQVA